MYKRTLMATLLMAGSATAVADPGVFFGVTYTFGHAVEGVGLSLKVMSTNKEDHAAVGAGVTYYPLLSENTFGVDVGVGYVFQDAAVTVGWDFMHSPQVGVGYVNTKPDRPAVAPVVD
jgi:hypothetical protein